MPETTAKTEHMKTTEPVTEVPVKMEQTEVMYFFCYSWMSWS